MSADDERIPPLTAQQLGLCGPLSDDPGVGPDAARHTPPVRVTANVILFKPSGKYYTEEPWRIPVGAIGPYDMKHSVDARRIDGGPVLVDTQEPWGYPHLFPADPGLSPAPKDSQTLDVPAHVPADPNLSEWQTQMRGFLGKRVEVVLNKDPRKVVVGVLHHFDTDGQVYVEDEDGSWGWAWPCLDIAVAAGPAEAAEPTIAERARAMGIKPHRDSGEEIALLTGQALAFETEAAEPATTSGVRFDEQVETTVSADGESFAGWTAAAAGAPEPALAAAARLVLTEWSRMHPSGYLAMYPAMDALRAAVAATPVDPAALPHDLDAMRTVALLVAAAGGEVRIAAVDLFREWEVTREADAHGSVTFKARLAGLAPALIGTWADPEFRAHQDHKHAVDDCGYCPSEEDR